ncbi:phage tail protein, partial [Vibrio anguillarum]|nr:phage tail protein [Vibrio anguillarum]
PFTLDLSALPTNSVTVIVGTENLNILIDAEFAIMAKTQVDTMHRQIKHEFRLLELEKAML